MKVFRLTDSCENVPLLLTNNEDLIDAMAFSEELIDLADSIFGLAIEVASALPPVRLTTRPLGQTSSASEIVHHCVESIQCWTLQWSSRVSESDGMAAADTLRALHKQFREAIPIVVASFEGDSLRPVATYEASWGSFPAEGRSACWVVIHDLCHLSYHVGQLVILARQFAGGAAMPCEHCDKGKNLFTE